MTETLLSTAAVRAGPAVRPRRLRVQAAAPAVIELPDSRRLLVFAIGCANSGVARDWAAGVGRPGVHFAPA